MSIIISKEGKNAAKIERSVIEQEDYLQRYIHDNPDTLPLGELQQDLRLLIVAREFAVTTGYIDALGVDQDGRIYVIETKRYKNPDKRLVIAQMLDYGAALWKTYSDPDDFIVELERYILKAYPSGLTAKISEYFAVDLEAVASYLDKIRQNISSGTFRFVVLMDRLDDHLKDLIAFVNSNSRFDVLGVELDFYRHNEFEVIIPRLFGAERKKDISTPSGGAKRYWDAETFFADLEKRRGRDVAAAMRKLYNWCDKAGAEITFGEGKETGTFSPSFQSVSRKLFMGYSDGRIELYFKYLSQADDTQPVVARFGAKLKEAGFALPEDYATRYVNLGAPDWQNRVDQLIAAIRDTVSGNA